MITIRKQSILTGEIHVRELPILPEQYFHWKTHDILIQDAFPNLTPGQREFLMTGITEEEWDQFKWDEENTDEN